jgi:hypothetical protein
MSQTSERTIGINTSPIADWSREQMFADCVLMARGWGSATNPGDGKGPVGPDGWPSDDFTIMLATGSNGYKLGEPDISGTYAIRFTGKASVGGWGMAAQPSTSYDPATNTTTGTITIPPSATTGTMSLSLLFRNTRRVPTDTGPTGVTNLEVMRPIAPGSGTPHGFDEVCGRPFKDLIGRYNPLRTMQTNAAIGSTERTWADRRRPVGPQSPAQAWGGKTVEGLAWELCVALANDTGKDIWICLPARADDDYFTKVAQVFKFGSDGTNPYTGPVDKPVWAPLKPGLKVYVEGSNEVWNNAYVEAHQIEADSRAYLAAHPGCPESLGGPKDGSWDWYFFWKYYMGRVRALSNAFRAVWGDDAMGPTIRVVWEGQYDNAITYSVPLGWLNDFYNNADGVQHVPDPHPVNYYLWGAGGAWYANVGNPKAGTVEDALRGVTTSNDIRGFVSVATKWSKAFGLHVTSYEGGAVAFTDFANAITIATNVDPRMEQPAYDAFVRYFQAGGEVGVIYRDIEGNYGQTANLGHLDTPKIKAFDRFMADVAKNGWPEPTVGDPIETLPPIGGAPQSWIVPGQMGLRGSALVRVTTPGDYYVQTLAQYPIGGVTARAVVNGQAVMPPTGLPAKASGYSPPAPVRLEPGLHGIVCYFEDPQGIAPTGTLGWSSGFEMKAKAKPVGPGYIVATPTPTPMPVPVPVPPPPVPTPVPVPTPTPPAPTPTPPAPTPTPTPPAPTPTPTPTPTPQTQPVEVSLVAKVKVDGKPQVLEIRLVGHLVPGAMAGDLPQFVLDPPAAKP